MSENEASLPQVGRNEPCPCGSGRKYKRCHGVDAAPKLTAPKMDPAANPMAALGSMGQPGMDGQPPFDPAMMMQFAQMMQRLPKGQLQRLQSIMQKAMAGKDVTREAREFEASLPPGFHEILKNFQMPGGGMPGVPGMPGMPSMGMPGMGMPGMGMSGAESPVIETTSAPVTPGGMPGGMTEEEARRLVAEAAAAGKISTEEAEKLGVDPNAAPEKGAAFSKLFKKK